MPLLPSFLLFTVAATVAAVLFVPNLLAGLANGIRYGDLKSRMAQSFFEGAMALSVFGNSAYANLLNALFAEHGGELHGDNVESISSVLGKRWTQNKNAFLGECLCGFLNLIDRDHCYHAALRFSPEWDLPKPESVALWKSLTGGVLLVLLLGLTLWVLFL